ncbi:fatty-acid synthase domain protein [Mycobacterium xenopi 4042]|uniref:Fatty-acid synthase domain protein n=1 Tax=Mycobacterium xenopi 4042 TaxID=1299334 RepID=X8E5Q4_MYCXE|nr:fatty-acid synthase domain protein [Mycobacterium xenopi 4042]
MAADAKLDMADLAAKPRTGLCRHSLSRSTSGHHCRAAVPPRGYTGTAAAVGRPRHRPADLVVIVGGAELGPYGSSRTRFEMEVDNELSAAGVLELAWTTG